MASNYRKIYKKHYGPIPCDSYGRSYEIHHIDGNHNNNDPKNLIAITLQEHYDIHYAQGDWSACYYMSIQRMNKTPAELSDLSKKIQLERVKNGTHHFLDGKISKKTNQTRVNNGTHHFLKRKDGTSIATDRAKNGLLPVQLSTKNGANPWQKRKDGSSIQKDLVKAGKHHLLGGAIQQKQLAEGTHPSKIKIGCLCCRSIFSSNSFGQHKCKQHYV